MDAANSRRQFLWISALAGSGLALTACRKQVAQDKTKETKDQDEEGAQVTATEDLMREHSVLRRALLLYAETVPKLRSDPSSIAPDALQKTAKLFRAFGEEYHEKKLEETYISGDRKSGWCGSKSAGHSNCATQSRTRDN